MAKKYSISGLTCLHPDAQFLKETLHVISHAPSSFKKKITCLTTYRPMLGAGGLLPLFYAGEQKRSVSMILT